MKAGLLRTFSCSNWSPAPSLLHFLTSNKAESFRNSLWLFNASQLFWVCDFIEQTAAQTRILLFGSQQAEAWSTLRHSRFNITAFAIPHTCFSVPPDLALQAPPLHTYTYFGFPAHPRRTVNSYCKTSSRLSTSWIMGFTSCLAAKRDPGLPPFTLLCPLGWWWLV